ncbi:MAG: gluconate 2-dehydrogenase subunit 3 family protein [Rhodospirillales bacterium]
MGTALAPAVRRAFESGTVIEKDDIYVLNYATKQLARANVDERHNFGQFPQGDPRARICESWRFPVIEGYYDPVDPEESYRWNEVTFVYRTFDGTTPGSVSVLGTFAPLYQEISLRRVGDTPYFAVTVMVPKGEVHTYRYLVDGRQELDPINPQTAIADNGRVWSRFFTQGCTQRLSFEPWEMDILERLTDHILPFRTVEGRRFLDQYYQQLDRAAKESQYPGAYRFDESVSIANFIDKLVAREENHRLIDYKICLGIINRVLRVRNPFVEPRLMSKEMYIELYNQMASGNVPGWDYGAYQNPRFFLQLLRRHAITGAFAHPKYGGNAGASGWAYLSERYRDPQTGATLFDWRRALEPPLGTNEQYRG